MLYRRQILSRVFTLGAVCAAASGCGDVLGPIQTVQPELAEMRVGFVGSGDEALIHILAQIVDAGISFGEHDRVQVSLRMGTEGPQAEVALRPELCGSDGQLSQYRCDQVIVMLHTGTNPTSIRVLARELPGRFVQAEIHSGLDGSVAHVSPELGTVFLLEGSVEAALGQVAGWPGVRHAELNRPGRIGNISDGSASTRFTGYAPLPEVATTGELHATMGSSEIIVEYEQPNGEILRATATLPE